MEKAIYGIAKLFLMKRTHTQMRRVGRGAPCRVAQGFAVEPKESGVASRYG